VDRPVQSTSAPIPQAPCPCYRRARRAEMLQEIGLRPIIEGGLTIVCEMEPEAQRAAERIARRAGSQLAARFPWIRAETRREPLQVAILSVDPRNGGVRALVGGSDYNLSPFDRTSAMRRQPGSAVKTFTYLAALGSKEATPASLLLDAPLRVAIEGDEPWEPQNYDQQFR